MAHSWRELVSDDDAIAIVRDWIAMAPTAIELLPCEAAAGQRTLEALQVTTRSPLGAVAFHTGGIRVDHGWLRILGAGSPELPRALDLWNGLGGARRCAEGLLVGDDAVGGFFAWFEAPRTVHYLAPDALDWLDLELGYSAWLSWCLTEPPAPFYADLRWDGWEREVATLRPDEGILVSPPLWTKGPGIGERSRGAVPVQELWGVALDVREQLRGPPRGEPG